MNQTATTDAPPRTCPECSAPVNPDNFVQLRPDGPWLLAEDGCAKCSRDRTARALAELRATQLSHYRQKIPQKYRSAGDGGLTDTTHPSWAEFKGGGQLAHLSRWNRVEKPWAAIVGKGGKLKSRVIGLYARSLALEGLPLLWVNGSSLSWANATRTDRERSSRSIHYLDTWRTHPGVLLLDDLWKGSSTPSYFDRLYQLLEHRNAHNLPLLWTANTHPTEIASKIPSDLREPIVGRLLENTYLLNLET